MAKDEFQSVFVGSKLRAVATSAVETCRIRGIAMTHSSFEKTHGTLGR